jgi:hypothetical protein
MAKVLIDGHYHRRQLVAYHKTSVVDVKNSDFIIIIYYDDNNNS